MKTQEIKHIQPLTVAKIFGLIYGIMGLLFGLIFSLVSTSRILLFGGTNAIMLLLTVLGITLALTIGYGLLGFLSGAASAWLYNIVAKKIGGIEIELK
jgi:hypothetical protein